MSPRRPPRPLSSDTSIPSALAPLRARLVSLVEYALASALLPTALFYAYRLHALLPDDALSARLLATCLLRQGNPHSAIHLLQQHSQRDIPCALVYADAASKLGKAAEASSILTTAVQNDPSAGAEASSPRESSLVQIDTTQRVFGSPDPFHAVSWHTETDASSPHPFPPRDASAIECTLGHLALKANQPSKALTHFRRAVSLNCWLWEAWTALCSLDDRQLKVKDSRRRGAKPRPQEAAEADAAILSILRIFVDAQRCLSTYSCREAITTLRTLPANQLDSPDAQLMLAQAYREMALYPRSAEHFVRVRALEPFRVRGMDVYSTVLWHLSGEVALSHLAQSLADVDRQASQTWVAVGNAHSLMGDHSEALKAFLKAAQVERAREGGGDLDVEAYAWTLAGHECMQLEEVERGIGYYRRAVARTKRLYNAWYGLGQAFLTTGKLQKAQYHLGRAIEINPSNAVLRCFLGMVLEKQHEQAEALAVYTVACELAPESAMARFKRAGLLAELGKWDDAASDLYLLLSLAPAEANVHLLLGRVLYHRNQPGTHDRETAMHHFATALDLDPKSAAVTKKTIEAAKAEEGRERD